MMRKLVTISDPRSPLLPLVSSTELIESMMTSPLRQESNEGLVSNLMSLSCHMYSGEDGIYFDKSIVIRQPNPVRELKTIIHSLGRMERSLIALINLFCLMCYVLAAAAVTSRKKRKQHKFLKRIGLKIYLI